MASYALGEEVWDGVRADWRTAPIDERLRAALGFIEKQTLHPDELTEADAEAAYAAGVSRKALHNAAHVAALFNMIVRLADAFGVGGAGLGRHAARARDARGRVCDACSRRTRRALTLSSSTGAGHCLLTEEVNRA